MRPPQLRCVFFSSMYLPHLLVLPATFWTSVPFATLSVFPSLICGSCPSGQRFAYSFFQIPSHGGHPCCSAMCFVVAYAHLGLSPIRKRPCWANKIPAEPFLWDVQFIIHKPISFVTGAGKEHPGLAVFRFPQAATVLPFYPGGMLPFFLQSLCHPRTTCRSLPQSAWTGAPGRYPEGAAHQKGNG